MHSILSLIDAEIGNKREQLPQGHTASGWRVRVRTFGPGALSAAAGGGGGALRPLWTGVSVLGAVGERCLEKRLERTGVQGLEGPAGCSNSLVTELALSSCGIGHGQ